MLAVFRSSSLASGAGHAGSRATAEATSRRDFIDDAKLFYRVVACGGTRRRCPASSISRRSTQHCAELAKTLRVHRRRTTSTPARDVLRDDAPGGPADDGRLSVRRWRLCSPRSSRIPTRATSRRSRSSTPAIRRGSRSSTKKSTLRDALVELPRRGRRSADAARLDEREHAQARERRHPRPAVVPHHRHDGASATSRSR